MTKQEQIEEMTKIIQHKEEIHSCEDDVHCENCFCAYKNIAEELYNAGYRKIDDLKAENKQLKTECALLDDELRIARQDTIDVLNELKAKSYVNDYCREVVEIDKIDELLKEKENADKD